MDYATEPSVPGDLAGASGAKELAALLREGGFSPLCDLLEAGKPLSIREIARQLKISRTLAKEMLDGARKLLKNNGADWRVPAEPKPKAKKKAKSKAVKAKPAALPAVKHPQPEIKRWPDTLETWEAMAARAVRAAMPRITILTRDILLRFLNRLDETGGKSQRAST